MTQSNEQIKHIEEKVKFLLHASINCHPSMKKYYLTELDKYENLLKK